MTSNSITLTQPQSKASRRQALLLSPPESLLSMLLYLQSPEQNSYREFIGLLPQSQQPVRPSAWVPPSHANAASPGSRPTHTSSRPAARSHRAFREEADHSHAAFLHTAPAHPAHVIDLTADDRVNRGSSVDSDLMIVSQPLVDAAAGHAAQTARTHGHALQAASAAPDQTQHCVESRGLSAVRQRPVAAVSGVAQRQHDHPEHEGNAVTAYRKRSRWDMKPADMQATAELFPPGHHSHAEHSQTQQQISPVPYCEDGLTARAEAVSDRLAPHALSHITGARDSRHVQSAVASRDQLDKQQEACLSLSQFSSGSHTSDRAAHLTERPNREHSGRRSRRSEQGRDRQSRSRQSSHRSDAKRKEPRHRQRHSDEPRISQAVHLPISDVGHMSLAHTEAQPDCHAAYDSPDIDRWQMW